MLHYAGSFQKKEMACVENSCRSRFLVHKKGVGVSIFTEKNLSRNKHQIEPTSCLRRRPPPPPTHHHRPLRL